MDANWAHVIQSANQTFLPSGIGGLSRTVSAKLADMVSTGDYPLPANFNTAQAALTVTIGVKGLRIGDGTSSTYQLTFPVANSTAVFATTLASATFNGVADPTYAFGYSGTAEPTLGDNFEAHYFDGASHFMEQNKDYTSADGVTAVGKRFYGFQLARTTPQAKFTVAAWNVFI